jgi:hypothetical protein
MSHTFGAPEDRFAAIVDALLRDAAVTLGSPGKKGFGSSALRIDNSIFAMLSKGKLVVKLPRQRVDALIAAGAGERFDPGPGRLMKEWVTIAPESEVEWLPLASEAMAFVGAQRRNDDP